MLKPPSTASDSTAEFSTLWSCAEALIQLEHHLNLCEDPSKELKRLQFWIYELQSLNSVSLGPLHRVELLRDFFFTTQQIHICQTPTEIQSFSLSHLLRKKSASTTVCSIAWMTLGAAIGLEFLALGFKPGRYLKLVTQEGNALFLDLHNKGHYLEDREILDLLESPSTGLRTIGLFDKSLDVKLLTSAIVSAQAQLLREQKPSSQLLTVYKTLVQLQPSNTHFIAEKALLHAKLGDNKAAYSELKRLFFLTEKSKVSPELVKLYQKLSNKTDLDPSCSLQDEV